MELCGDRGGAVDLLLEEAIRHKYCPLVEDNTLYSFNHVTIKQTALKHKPGTVSIGICCDFKYGIRRQS
jgi:hypothetical protein